MQPAQQDRLPQENTGDISVQVSEDPNLLDQPVTSVQLPEEPDLLDQPVTSVQLPEDTDVLNQPMTEYPSASEISQKPSTEKEIDLGKFYSFSLWGRGVL